MSMKTNGSESIILIKFAGQICCPYFLFLHGVCVCGGGRGLLRSDRIFSISIVWDDGDIWQLNLGRVVNKSLSERMKKRYGEVLPNLIFF